MKVRSGMEDLVLRAESSRCPACRWAPTAAHTRWTRTPPTASDSSRRASVPISSPPLTGSRARMSTPTPSSRRRGPRRPGRTACSPSVVPVRDRNGLVILEEHLRPGATLEALAGLQPSFALVGESGGFDAVALQRYHWVERIEHVHHAGNSSGIVDGAALAGRHGCGCRGRADAARPDRLVGLSGSDPRSCSPARCPRAVERWRGRPLIDDIDLFEVNEAFAAVPMRFMREMGVPHDKVNVNGGAIAMGHPLGATGAMMLGVGRRARASPAALRPGHLVHRRRHGCCDDRGAGLMGEPRRSAGSAAREIWPGSPSWCSTIPRAA